MPSCPFLTLWINVLCQFESIRVGQISVGWSDGQDQAAFSADELHNHVPDLLLDVHRLVSNGHLSDPRQVDESQVQHCTVRRIQYKKKWLHLCDILLVKGLILLGCSSVAMFLV